MYCESSPQKINEKPQVIGDYECGRAIPNNQVMGKIERAIGNKMMFVCFSRKRLVMLIVTQLSG